MTRHCLAAGRQFTAQLKLDAEADARLFQAVGLDRAAALLSAVMSRGQEQDATTDDWAAMHRATAGLVELFVQKGELLRASIFAYTQSLHYRISTTTMRRRWGLRGNRWNYSGSRDLPRPLTSRGRRWPAT